MYNFLTSLTETLKLYFENISKQLIKRDSLFSAAE